MPLRTQNQVSVARRLVLLLAALKLLDFCLVSDTKAGLGPVLIFG